MPSQNGKNSRGGVVVLIGAARSGTKYLRSLLSASQNVRSIGYDINYVWRYGQQGYPHDALPPDLLTDRSRKAIRKQVYQLAKMSPQDPYVLVEKSVSNALRIPYVDSIFPDAKFIHLLRDGRAVTESAMRLWDTPPDHKALLFKLRDLPLSNIGYVFWFARNLIVGRLAGREGGKVWGPRYEGIDTDAENLPLLDVCARQWRECAERAHRDLSQLRGDRVFTVRYEDLISNENTVRELVEFAGVGDMESVLEFYRRGTIRNQDMKWKENLTPNERDRLECLLHAPLKAFGFDE